jgi:ParB family chromosome partitioning protein
LLKKHEFDVDKFVDEVEVFNVISSQDVELAQVQLLEHYQHTLDKMLAKPKKAEPRVENLVLFENRNKYARINVSSDGRKAKFEFGYLTKEELGDIETFVRERLAR